MLVCSHTGFNHFSVRPLQENIELALADTEPTSWGSVAAVDQPSHQALVSPHSSWSPSQLGPSFAVAISIPQTCSHRVDEELEALVLMRGRKGDIRCFPEGLGELGCMYAADCREDGGVSGGPQGAPVPRVHPSFG